MSYAVIHRFEGGTEAQYRATVAAVHPADGLPDGQLLHVAGPDDDGWTIFAIHDSRESWERFRDETLTPRMREGVEGGFTSPPQEITFEIRNQQRHAVHAAIRHYTGGADALFDEMERHEPEIRDLITTVPGFVEYAALRTPEGGMTITLCEDRDGTDESTRRAARWVRENVDASVDPPTILEGDTVLQF